MEYNLNDHIPTRAGVGAAWAVFLMLGLGLASPSLLCKSVHVAQTGVASVERHLPQAVTRPG